MPTPLRDIRKFTDLVRYLETELEWPVQAGSFDDLTFEYQPAELGLKDEDAVKIKKIHQLRPLAAGQPWGIFFIEFEKKKLPVVVLRCILSHLVVKKRQSANQADQAVWNPEDLLFISAFGDEATDQREIAFAHFHQQAGDLPTLNVLGWDGSDTPLKLDYVAGQLKGKLHWPANPKDQNAWRAQWRAPFRHRLGHVIRTADSLAEVLAALARGIRDNCKIKMRAESEHGALTKLYQGFQTALIHDLKPDDFADTYAQTITYGLLTAAISRTEMSEGRHGTVLFAENVTDMVPVTNPFLKEMLQTFLKVGGRKGGIDFDELGIQDVVELLRGEETDLPAILRDFGNKTRGEDPVIHFYEHFLSAYNKQLKIQRGVFYTPQPVVSYIVRSVHELLQTEFGLEDGLASTVTWGEMIARSSRGNEAQTSSEKGKSEPPHVGCYELKLPEGVEPGEMFVQILDPATGTATFLVEVIDVIYKHLKTKWDQGGVKAMPALPQIVNRKSQILNFPAYWNQYVPLALLPRLHGYELMMAPYAIAHMKIGLKLHETGYHFGTEERARIYLTNALEPKVTQLPQIGFEPLAHEAKAVNEIKWYKRFTVVIGNPPYSVSSTNKSEFIDVLIGDYKTAVKSERNLQPLSDDYVKFIRFAEAVVSATGCGTLGFITNHAFLFGLIHRGMREHLTCSFNNLKLLDLYGNTTTGELNKCGTVDQNVFDIQQGVAITIGVKSNRFKNNSVEFTELIGPREKKYSTLRGEDGSISFRPLRMDTPYFFFRPKDFTNKGELAEAVSISELLTEHKMGIQFGHVDFVTDFDREQLVDRIKQFFNPKMADSQLESDFALKDMSGWTLSRERKIAFKDGFDGALVCKVDIRPFDTRWTYFSKRVLKRPVVEIMAHLTKKNLALIGARHIRADDYAHFLATNHLVGKDAISMTDMCFVFPLYLYPASDGLAFDLERHPNLALRIVMPWLNKMGGSPNWLSGKSNSLEKISPEDIFHYAYGVFHSPGYRSRYAEFLKIEFPRLPLTGNLELFRALARLGGELTALHLLESPTLEKPITEYLGGRSPEVEKVSWSENTVWLDKDQTTGFKSVREDVWKFHIGGYQVCEKWLKDRKGRTLSADDRTHYQKIVIALSETIRLMKEIDAVIEKHGGWPLK